MHFTFYSYHRNTLRTTCLLLLYITIFASCKFREKADLVVHHAVIYTANDSFAVAEAMAISEGKIIAIGSNDVVLKKYESAETIDAGGKFIYPGFIDAHCHFTGYATDSWKCDLVGTTSWEEVISKLKTYSTAAPMEWLYGRGWDQNDWVVKEFPDKSILDSLFPARPVYLKRVDGHAAIANTVALQIAGVTDSSSVEGGEIEKKNGKLTGLLIDNAMRLVENRIPDINDSLAKKYFIQLQEKCFAYGLTGVHDCGVTEHTVQLLKDCQEDGNLKMKIFALLRDDSTYYDKWIQKGRQETGCITVGGFKIYADGALGSRGACLLHDYSDKPGWKGFLLSSPQYFQTRAQQLMQSNLQMCTHAIGDSANREILNIYASVLEGKNDRRWRIEHAQVVDPTDFAFFADNNIIPSVQPTHATSDMYWAGVRLGKARLANAYAYQQLLEANGWMPLGTDFPVEDISPFKTFFAAVVRKDAQGFPASGFQIENALTRQQAIMGMTIWAAKAAFEEKQKGSLEKGKAADFIMLDTDLMQCEESKILATKVLSTFIDGKQVFASRPQ